MEKAESVFLLTNFPFGEASLSPGIRFRGGVGTLYRFKLLTAQSTAFLTISPAPKPHSPVRTKGWLKWPGEEQKRFHTRTCLHRYARHPATGGDRDVMCTLGSSMSSSDQCLVSIVFLHDIFVCEQQTAKVLLVCY